MMKILFAQCRSYSEHSFPKIFVKNLPWTVSEKELSEYFSKFGSVIDSKVIFDAKTKMSKGFGFVSFKESNAYDDVLNCNEHLLEGRRLKIEKSTNDWGSKE